uniref:Uncharacterized protein n=1 Tax=Minutocellus polymorphus TaxID=265543 RepID=A0A7S0AFM0_9STRA|mmetsp:Transcript_12547/g.20874  ORF Transcript_12547/g.20874 Transcript_12547/m.20874 type:complete len:260 (+) Transcript_12547:74-853(+)
MKHVNFNQTVSIRRHRVDGGTTSWLTDEDYHRILRGVRKTARSIRKGASIDENMTSRGIEHLRSAEDLERQIVNKDCAIGVVLSEQRRIADAGFAIADAVVVISKAYRKHTRWARENALHRAASDEAFVRSNVKTTTSSPTPDAADAQSPDPSSEDETNASQSLRQLSSLTIDDSDGCVDVAIQQQNQQSMSSNFPSRSAGGIHAPSRISPLRTPRNNAESSPNAWLNHHDSLRLSGVKSKNTTGTKNRSHFIEENSRA